MNPFAALYDACNHGTGKDKLAGLGDGPRIVDVEPTNACNFRCLMCPTGNKAMKRDTGVMAPETFHALADMLPPGTGVRFIGWGEPLMHPDIVRFVNICHRKGLLTHLNTNGSHLDGSLASRLVAAGLTSIKFSFQGVERQSYREMRNTDFFDGLFETVKMFHRVRAGTYPFIQVSTTTTYETAEQVEAFRKLFAPICDHLSVGRTIFAHMDLGAARLRPDEADMLQRLSGYEPKLKHPDPCPEVYDKLTVAWDGTVRVCCNDYDGHTVLGNVNTHSLAEIWRHPVIEEYRARLADGEYSGPLCGGCFDYMETTEGEKAA